ncbi:hypothetical protein IJG04_02365 [Candidatus Saccharibacteria bacterium]|nr:hypothetical protein [Candidatus Saccharibacteria bacterium]
MKSKNNKPSLRIKINTALFILMALIFGAITFYGINQLSVFRKNLIGVSDAPALCYNEELYEQNNGTIIQDTYPCISNGTEEATDLKDHTMFLYDRISLTATINSWQNDILLVSIGSMLTIGSLISAIIYWNHNRQ